MPYVETVAPIAISKRTTGNLGFLGSRRKKGKGPSSNHLTGETHSIVTSIECDTSFDIIRIPLNAGSFETFPQLASIARAFAKYQMDVSFEYVPVCPTSTAGCIGIGWSPNPNELTPSDFQELSQMTRFVTGSVFAPLSGSLPPSKTLLVRDEGLRGVNAAGYGGAPTPELAPYDHGVLFVATYAAAASTIVGNLFMKARYTLKDIEPSDPPALKMTSVDTASITSSAPFGVSSQMGVEGDFAISRYNVAGVAGSPIYIHQPGRWMVTMHWNCTSATALSTFTLGGDCNVLDWAVDTTAGLTNVVWVAIVEVPSHLGNTSNNWFRPNFTTLTTVTYVHVEFLPIPRWLNYL
jgi:hypothetical protein